MHGLVVTITEPWLIEIVIPNVVLLPVLLKEFLFFHELHWLDVVMDD